MRIAIVHQWFMEAGGAEKVTEVLAQMYPTADIFALFASLDAVPASIRGRNLKISFLNRIPGSKKFYKHLLPLYPLGVESLDLRDYDLVISSDPGPVKGVLVNENAVHVCYCHTPMRYVWDSYPTYRNRLALPLRTLFSIECHYIRQWDYIAAQRVDCFVANSTYVAQRIRKYYRRESVVVYPPLDNRRAYLADSTEDYYVTVGRLSHTKRLDVIIRACNQLKRRLVIVGGGKELRELKSLAGPTVEFTGFVSESERDSLYARCRAFLFAANEDFGIAPLEAQSFGRPVLAYAGGGALETVIGLTEGGGGVPPTGILFNEQTPESLVDAILRFESRERLFDPPLVQEHAQRFDTNVFVSRMENIVMSALQRPQMTDTLAQTATT
jgi:glycosyltransferase involved in cell wall biosynthesis